MKGFILTGLTDKGSEFIRKFNVKDKKAVILLFENPTRLEFTFYARFRPFVSRDAAQFFIDKTFKGNGLIPDIDYKIDFM